MNPSARSPRPDVIHVPDPLAPARLPADRRPWRHWLLQPVVLQFALMAALALCWELAARWNDNPLLLPTFLDTARALSNGLLDGELIRRSLTSLGLLAQAYAVGVLLAAAITCAAMLSRVGQATLGMLTAMFNPLPAIALLPLAMMWFGLGTFSLIFVIIHSVVWPLALNACAGFGGVSPTLRLVGRNLGLSGLQMTMRILIPAALPSLFSGLRLAWAFAWRTLIAAELVFGAASSGQGGLGWYIFQNRNELNTDQVFAGLICVIAIGLLVETLVFENLERLTIRRWGMRHQN
ncbi:MAG: ABC transporter permease [Alcaligenes sp.]